MSDQGWGRSDEQEGHRDASRKFRQILAAGFLVAIVVAAGILFAVNRSGGSGATGGSSTVSGDPAQDVAWAGKKADHWGTMVYFPPESKGHPLTSTVRDYSNDPTAAASGTPSATVFETTDFSGGSPIPFSVADGPTGFDGTVPIGYSKSAAGAALAAAAYFPAQVSPVREHYVEFSEKAKFRPSSEDIDRARKRAEDPSQYRKQWQPDEIVGGAIFRYRVDVFDGDYARITLFLKTGKGPGIALADLRWDNNTWKIDDGFHGIGPVDEVPQEAKTWVH